MDQMDIQDLRDEYDDTEPAELPISEEELCQRYEELYTGAVSDALRERKLLNQALPPTITPLLASSTVAGIAFTIVSSPDPTIQKEMEVRAEMLDTMSEHNVCVWNATDDQYSSQWGEVMTATAKEHGCKGAVINGGIRDTNQILEQDFPVYYSYRTPNGALGRSRIQKYQTTILIDQTIIKPGDVVLADIDGVIIVPRKMAYEVLDRAEEIKRNDNEVRSWVSEGQSTTDIIDQGGYF